MVQHQTRVGDTLDDFCPRDNEVTAHTVVETNDDGASVTRCKACDAEHEYPGAGQKNGDGKNRRDGTVRRPLIRASLPHPDGIPPPREPPVFTMHEQPTRGNGWGKGGRGSNLNGGHNRDGNVQPKKHSRRRGGHGRPVNSQQPSGNQSGNRANGNQVLPEGRTGSKNQSSRRGRGRSR